MSFYYGVALLLFLPVTLATPDRCMLRMDAGPCLGHHRRWAMIQPRPWYHLPSSGPPRCISFLYGGCKGNLNNFRSKDECQRVCQLRNTEPFHDSSQNISSPGIMRDNPMADAGAGPGGPGGPKRPRKPVKPKTFQTLGVIGVVVILGCCLVAFAVTVLILSAGRKRRRRLRDELPEVTAF